MKINEAIKQKNFDTPQGKAWINLAYTFQELNDSFTEVIKPFDITPQQYNVLRILRGKYPDCLYCSEVKEVMMDKNPDLTRLSDRLVSKGLIARNHNEENRRQVLLSITQEGLDLLEKMNPVVVEHAKKFKNLSNEEAELLSDLLDKLRG